jgi:uncharacterized protein
MHLTAIETSEAMGIAPAIADLALARTLADAASGDMDACFDLGVVFSTGSNGMACDLVEAHKWFNLAAARGHEEAAHCRADVADEMTAREIAEAQRRAREMLAAARRHAA